MKPKLTIPSENDPSFRRIAIALLVLVEIMLYTPALLHGLVGDDYVFRELNERSLSSLWTDPPDILTGWRPLSYTLNHLLFSLIGESSFSWHAINLLLHLISVLLFFQVVLKCSDAFERKGLMGATLVAVIFQIHPAAVRSVYQVSAFSEILCMLFLLAATLVAMSGFRNPTTHTSGSIVLFFAAALLSNEAAVAYPAFLFLVLILMGESFRSLAKRFGGLLGVLVAMSLVSGLFYALAADRTLAQSYPGIGGSLVLLLHKISMLVIPTDSMSIVQTAVSSPWLAVIVVLLVCMVAVIAIRMKLADAPTISMATIALLAGLSLHALQGRVSLRLMYLPVAFFLLSAYCILATREWWKERNTRSRILLGSVLLFAGATANFAISAVLDWHVADKYGRAMKASFVDYHQLAQQKHYVFGAIPARLRQAAIVGDVSKDFRGELRQDEIADSVEMGSVLRIVLFDSDDPSANVDIVRISEKALIIQTQTENQFFLSGTRDSPLELPVGTVFQEGAYSVEVLETNLSNRATVVQISARDSSDLEKLLFYDDSSKNFVPVGPLSDL